MKIICVDDNKIILSHMLSYVKEQDPEADVFGFADTENALSFAKKNGCDVLITEIELGGVPSGLMLARQMQDLNARLNIIFSTVCSQKEYAEEVMALRPSGYLTKVVTKKDVQKALSSLLYAVG